MSLVSKVFAVAATVVVAVGLGLSSAPADAKRLGSGKNVGQQSQNVKRDATPTQPAAPAQNAAPANAGAGAAAAGTAAAATKKPWGAMLGGLAAGLGLAWLASSLGLGAAFGNILMALLIGVIIVAAIGFFLRKRAQSQGMNNGNSPYAFQGAGQASPQEAPQYRNSTVGNDASARPWERNSMAFEAPQAQPAGGAAVASGSMIGSNLRQASGWSVPADFDQQGFLASAKSSFFLLQAAWDRADLSTLRSMMTDEMLREIQSQLAEREQHAGAAPNHTEVPMLDAKLLGIEDLGQAYLASVEFSGMIREDAAQGPQPFREVWNLTKPKIGGGWLVAGLQALS